MGYIVNNIPVGQDPGEIERSSRYNEFFEKVGNSPENIKFVNNFISEEEIEYIFTSLSDAREQKWPSQKDNDGNVINWMYSYTVKDKDNIIDRVKQEVLKAYNFEHIKPKEDALNVVKWVEGSKLILHVDDLGYVTDNHIATLIYLNDDYEGGEIAFATHDFNLKPKSADLIIFPGNMHYAHEVKEVLSGTRYTLSIWFTIV
jgi:hypothetical protein